jgi:type II secretory pathway pseudopilin PulG
VSVLSAGRLPLQQQQQQQRLEQLRQQQLNFRLQQQSQQKIQQPFSSTTSTKTKTISSSMVGGRLQWFASEWHQISNSNFVNTIIAQGYRIPFVQTPPTTNTPGPIISFSKNQTCHLDQAIQDLLKKNAIEEVPPTQANQVPGFYSSMLVIPKKNGGIWPVFNLRKLKEYMDPPHFRMETIKEVAHLITYNDYLVSMDLTDTFLHMQ